jgi:SAM-dependent methyltransferase
MRQTGADQSGWLEQFYDAYPRIEETFHVALDESLNPRGPELLYDLVGDFGLKAGARTVDVGCGEGRHAFELARRFGFTVLGIDPLPRHVELATAAEAGERVRFAMGSADALPVETATVDLVWCRDVLSHVADPEGAYAEVRRVLRSGGRALVYQMFGTERLEPREAEWLWRSLGVVPTSTDPTHTEAAISAAGLRIDERVDIGSEWGERAEEQSGAVGRRLLHAARLLREPERYVERFGQAAYEIMLGDCLWHVYAMIGKLERRAYSLTSL